MTIPVIKSFAEALMTADKYHGLDVDKVGHLNICGSAALGIIQVKYPFDDFFSNCFFFCSKTDSVQLFRK